MAVKNIATIVEREDARTLLKLKEGFTKEELNRAYRKAALKTHPDLNPGKDTTEKMMRLIDAYKLLQTPLTEFDEYVSRFYGFCSPEPTKYKPEEKRSNCF